MLEFRVADDLVLEAPRSCPTCHRDVHLTEITAWKRLPWSSPEAVFECPYPECGHYFIALYPNEMLGSFYPNPFPVVLSTELAELSPGFQSVFRQAVSAKRRGLNDLMGMGFRKALEILLKDWFVAEAGDEPSKTKVRSETLVDTVRRLPDADLGTPARELADIVRHIGNDATHTVPKHPHLNANDAEELIILIVGWMEQQIRARHFARLLASSQPTTPLGTRHVP